MLLPARSIPAPASGVLLGFFGHYLAALHYPHRDDVSVAGRNAHRIGGELRVPATVELYRAALAAVAAALAAVAAAVRCAAVAIRAA